MHPRREIDRCGRQLAGNSSALPASTADAIPDGPCTDRGGDHAFADSDFASQMGHVTTTANHPASGDKRSPGGRVEKTGGQLGRGAP